METKGEYRRYFLQQARKASKAQREESGRIITERFLSLSEYASAKVVFSYLSMDYEVDTAAINAAVLADGKQLFVPRITGDVMDFVRYAADSALSQNKYGISEVQDGSSTALTPDIVIVPLVAFDSALNRLGHGKGFYDRFLQGKGYKTVALGYPWQTEGLITLPTDEYDVKMDVIITSTDGDGVHRRSK